MQCPRCGNSQMACDEIDFGVGVIQGPYWCDECGWYEGEASAQLRAWFDENEKAKIKPSLTEVDQILYKGQPRAD